MRPITIIGIDPGASGGIAWITDGDPCVEKMPDTLKDLWELFESITRNHAMIYRPSELKAYIEDVQPGGLTAAKAAAGMRMGAKSAFQFGRGVGNLEMALTAANIPFERVRPQEWQRAMKCLTKGDKNVSKARAQELFPGIKITHATADALLIAEYGRRANQ